MKLKANFEIHEMLKCDIERALNYFKNNEPEKNIIKSRPLLKTVLHDFGLENVRVHLRETTNNITINLEKITKDDLEPGDKVWFRDEKCRVDKVYDDIEQLRIIYGNEKVLVGKEEVSLCL